MAAAALCLPLPPNVLVAGPGREFPAVRAFDRLVRLHSQRRLGGPAVLASPDPRYTRSLFVGLRFPGQLALDSGLIEADDPLAAYLDDRHARLAGLLLDRAGGRRVALDVY
jgi:hypothetical protein